MIRDNIKLFWDAEEKIYHFTDYDEDCCYCHARIENVIVIKVGWDRLGSDVRYYCSSCKDKNMSFARVVETYFAIIDDNIRANFKPVLFHKPSIQDASNKTVFDVANINIDGEHVTDKTVYANKESLEGATIGKAGIIDELEKKDNNIISIDDGLDLLDNIGKATPLLTQDESDEKPKRLTHKKG